jgi:signal transduction histidine kinase
MNELAASGRTAGLRPENERLRVELDALAAELRRCRRHMTEAIEAGRRRIERDLHDATQQRLVSLALWLGLLEAKLLTDPIAARPIAREARAVLTEALEELRELTSGEQPSVLTQRGLAGALQELAARVAMPVHVSVLIDSRTPTEVESTAYFIASELVTNAVKHSHAQHVRIAAEHSRGTGSSSRCATTESVALLPREVRGSAGSRTESKR